MTRTEILLIALILLILIYLYNKRENLSQEQEQEQEQDGQIYCLPEELGTCKSGKICIKADCKKLCSSGISIPVGIGIHKCF
jgi:hypothetical protein